MPNPTTAQAPSSYSGLISSLLALLLLTACTTSRPMTGERRAVTDELGRTVQITPRPQRIISLAPNITEILFALGAGERVIANTTWCNYPAAAVTKEKVGDTQKPNLERIIALKPDLVIISTASQLQGFTERLTDLGIPVYVSNATSLDGIIASIEQIAVAIGEESIGRQLAARLRERIEQVKQRVAGRASPRVLFLLQEFPPLFTVGPGAYTNDLIEAAGGASIARKINWPNPYPQLNAEQAIAQQPEIIIFSSTPTATVEKVAEFPIVELRNTPAVQAGRVYRINAEHVVYAAPRIVDGLEAVARLCHPEAFN